MFLSEYDCQVVYRPGAENGAAEFVSRQEIEETALRLRHDGKIAVVTMESDTDMKPFLVEFKSHWSDEEVAEKDAKLCSGIRGASKYLFA